MAKVTINSPKTPVTKGSMGIAAATVPNVCKMPGPPAPFVPTPLPNIGKSGDSPQGYSTTVKIEGQPVAIRGASFGSMGDVASQGTGGGLISSNTQGRTKFIGLGSLNVKIEGKNVQLLGDPMLNRNAKVIPLRPYRSADARGPAIGQIVDAKKGRFFVNYPGNSRGRLEARTVVSPIVVRGTFIETESEGLNRITGMDVEIN